MKCITFGYVIFLLILASFILIPVTMVSPKIGGILYVVTFVGLNIYWLYGWASNCDDGYLGGLKRI